MARKKPEGGEGKRSLREKLSEGVDTAFRNYDEFVGGMNRPVEEGLKRLAPRTMRDLGDGPDFDPAGFMGSVGKIAGKTPRVWKAAAAGPGEGGFVKEGGGIWNMLKKKLGPNPPDDEVAKAAHNYAEMWEAGEKTDALVNKAVRATQGKGIEKGTLRGGLNPVADEVDLLTDTSRLNKVKKPDSADELADWKKLDEAEADEYIKKSMSNRGEK